MGLDGWVWGCFGISPSVKGIQHPVMDQIEGEWGSTVLKLFLKNQLSSSCHSSFPSDVPLAGDVR